MKYTITTTNEFINEVIKVKIKNLKIDEQVTFETNEKGYNYLKNSIRIDQCLNNYQFRFVSVFKKHIITIISIIILILTLNLFSKSITKIKFIDSYNYNQEILETISNDLYQVGPFKFLKHSINSLNQHLRSKYYAYEWIGVIKKGTTLYIEIEKNESNNQINLKDVPGNLVSSKNAIIKYYHLEKGVVLIQEDQAVQKGEILISGEIKHYNDNSEYIHPIGYVIGETVDVKTITINKNIVNIKRSGKINVIDVWKDPEIIKTDFANYEIEYKNIFKLFKKQFMRLYIYELIQTETSYNENDAIEYAKTILMRDFYESERLELEKIIYIKHIETTEDDDCYYVKLVIKAHENIAEFKKNQ